MRLALGLGITIVLAMAGVLALLFIPGASATTYDNDPFMPKSIVVGPNSTEFMILDESRGKTVVYYCGFLSPRDIGRNTGGSHPLEIYVPAIQCNK